MKGFINQLLTVNSLTDSFLDRYNILFVPLMNPDGVMNGFWRYNANKKDLNRDWGNFTQPETDAVYKKLTKLSNKKLILFIDFHSTFKNIFYIQDELETAGYNFAQAWLLENLSDKSNYKFVIKPTKNINNGVAKNYFNSSYGIPAITFEVGDNTDRGTIINSSKNLANSMMSVLLENN